MNRKAEIAILIKDVRKKLANVAREILRQDNVRRYPELQDESHLDDLEREIANLRSLQKELGKL